MKLMFSICDVNFNEFISVIGCCCSCEKCWPKLLGVECEILLFLLFFFCDAPWFFNEIGTLLLSLICFWARRSTVIFIRIIGTQFVFFNCVLNDDWFLTTNSTDYDDFLYQKNDQCLLFMHAVWARDKIML